MIDKGRSPRMVEYVMATIRQVWNQARRDGLINTESPTKSVKIIQNDNKRLRFLTHQEANNLLEALRIRDKQTYQIAIISLNTGMRVGEVFKLTWGDIDIKQGLITVRDAKSGSRIAFMTDALKLIFEGIGRKKNDDFVFLSPISKKPFEEMPDIFSIVVNEIGLNKDIDDRRQKIVPHSLRHTFASWLVQGGVDLYTVQKLMGHGTIAMTQRYAHLSPKTLQEAVKTLERGINASKNIVKIKSKK
jgi:integrase